MKGETIAGVFLWCCAVAWLGETIWLIMTGIGVLMYFFYTPPRLR